MFQAQYFSNTRVGQEQYSILEIKIWSCWKRHIKNKMTVIWDVFTFQPILLLPSTVTLWLFCLSINNISNQVKIDNSMELNKAYIQRYNYRQSESECYLWACWLSTSASCACRFCTCLCKSMFSSSRRQRVDPRFVFSLSERLTLSSVINFSLSTWK